MGDSKYLGHEVIAKYNNHLFIFACLIFFAAASLMLWQQVPNTLDAHTDFDSKAYLEHAHLLYTNHSFAWPREGMPYYVLGYPFIMGVLYHGGFGESKAVIIFFQLFVALLTGLLLFSLAQRLCNDRAARIALILFSCNIGFLTFTQFILTEIVLTCLLTLFVWFTVLLCERPGRWALAGSALSLSFSVLIKPAGLYFTVLYLPFLFWLFIRHGLMWRYIIARLSKWLALFLLPLGLYMGHNKYVFGQAYISKLGRQNLYYWFYPNVRAALHNSSADQERLKLLAMPEKLVKKQFITDALHHPFIYAFVWGKNMIKTLVGLFSTNLKVLVEPTTKGGDVSFFKTRGSIFQRIKAYVEGGTTTVWLKAVAYTEALWSAIRLIFVLYGAWWLYTFMQPYAIFLLLYSGYFILITGHDGCARFRMMIEVPLLLCVAIGVWALYTRFKRKRVSV